MISVFTQTTEINHYCYSILCLAIYTASLTHCYQILLQNLELLFETIAGAKHIDNTGV